MTDLQQAGNELLDAWLNLSSTMWNTRLVKTLTYNETHVLGILLRHSQEKALTATDLIRRTRLLKSQMNKLLTTLEKRGFIMRSRSGNDKRQIDIHLTPQGTQAYLQEHRCVEAFLDQIIARFGTERSLSVARELSDINRILDEIVPLPR